MATLVAGTDGTYTGYSDGTAAGAFGSLVPDSLNGNEINAILTAIGSNDIVVVTASGSEGSMANSTLVVDGVEYAYQGQTAIGFVVTTYTGVFDFVNGVSYEVDILGPPEYEGPSLPEVTPGVSGAGAITVDFTGRVTGGIGQRAYIAVMTANQTMPTPSGWNLFVPDSGSPFRGTAGAAGGVKTTLFWKDVTGSETTVALGDSGDIQLAFGFVLQPSDGTGITHMESVSGNAASSTSGVFTNPTTTEDNCRIVNVVCHDRDATGSFWSAHANADLSTVQEVADLATATNTGGGVMIMTGGKMTAGSIANSTATQSTASAYTWISFAARNTGTGGAIIEPVVRANEVDVARNLGVALGTNVAVERDVALARTVAIATPVVVAVERDVALSLVPYLSLATTPAIERDSALPLGSGVTPTIASELDLGLALDYLPPSNQILCAGSSGSFVGYRPGLYGTLTPSTIFGAAVERFYIFGGSNIVFEAVGDITGDLAGLNLFLDGVEYIASGINFNGTNTEGTFIGPSPAFIDGECYDVTFAEGTLAAPVVTAVERDVALALTPFLSRDFAPAVERDVAIAPSSLTVRLPGVAVEVDTAITLFTPILRPVVAAVEVDLALPLGSATIKIAHEVDVAVARPAVTIRPVVVAVERDVALAPTPVFIRQPGIAVERDTALPLTARLIQQVVTSYELDHAYALGRGYPVVPAVEVDRALALKFGLGIVPATEVDLAVARPFLEFFPVIAAVEHDLAIRLWPGHDQGEPDSTSVPQLRGSTSVPQSRGSTSIPQPTGSVSIPQPLGSTP